MDGAFHFAASSVVQSCAHVMLLFQAASASGSGSGAAESKAPTVEQLIERKAYSALFETCQQKELEVIAVASDFAILFEHNAGAMQEAGVPPKNADATINNLTLQLTSALLLGDK